MSERHEIDEHPSDELAALALGALDSGEEAAVRRHLDACERCRAELLWLQPAVDVLPSSVEQLEPPRRLKRNLVKASRADAREAQGGWSLRAPGWISTHVRPALALAATALLGAGIAGYVVNEADRAGERTVTAVKAKPIDTAPSSAAAVLEHSDSEAKLVVERLPELDADSVYQLWYHRGEDFQPASTFELDAEGRAVADVGEIPEGTEEILVTEEPAGGSVEPHGAVLLSAPLS